MGIILKDRDILFMCANATIYFRGIEYYTQKRIYDYYHDPEKGEVRALARGEDYYRVRVNYSNEIGEIESFHCSCPFYSGRGNKGACKHIAAVLKTLQSDLSVATENLSTSYDELLSKRFLDSLRGYKSTQGRSEINVEVLIGIDTARYGNITKIEFKLGMERLYKLKDINAFIKLLTGGGKLVLGKSFEFDTAVHTLPPRIKRLFEFYQMALELIPLSGSSHGFKRDIVLNGRLLTKTAELLRSIPFQFTLNGYTRDDIEIKKTFPPIEYTIDKNQNEYILKCGNINDIIPLDRSFGVVYYENALYVLTNEQSQLINRLYTMLHQKNVKQLTFTQQQKNALITDALPRLKTLGNVQLAEVIKDDFVNEELTIKVFLDSQDEEITAKVDFCYGDICFNHFARELPSADEKIIIRDGKKENEFIMYASQVGFEPADGLLRMSDTQRIYSFITEQISGLINLAQVYYSESFKALKPRRPILKSGGISLSNGGLLEFSFDYDINTDELASVLAALREKKKYYRLKGGSFISLEDEALEEIADAMRYLDIKDSEVKKGKISVPKYRATYLDGMLTQGRLNIKADEGFKRIVEDLKNPSEMEFRLPKGMMGILRHYQEAGFKWFKTLSTFGFGGILADEMGLGKTLQAIAFVESEYQNNKKPTLIVAPTSLLYNWRAEVEKFTKGMRVLIAEGLPSEREQLLCNAADYHFVITSYGLLRNDIKEYAKHEFAYCIIDEAQNIKNPHTLNAKAVKSIRAGGFFALTGTPIENNLTELWSIFDFIMPGYLYTHAKFRNLYEAPIARDNNQNALKQLLRHVKPFILRRVKSQVLTELPDKIENEMIAELTDEQKKIYLAYAARAKTDIAGKIEQAGLNKSKIEILSILMRLRQLCCHPGLFIEGYKGGSGKLEMLNEIIDEALQSGKRMLIFSQFTSMLGIIADMLKKQGIEYYYLDGTTPSKDRLKMTQQFNEGSTPVFLISLKAGGTGLNLTGADTVVHFDPWWNPAVENQATDRAHRIGQKKVVQVIRLVAKGTIEEKIFELKLRKQDMTDKLLEPGEAMLSNMSKEEVLALFE